MSCTTIVVDGKVVGLACSRSSGKKCVQCGQPAGALCDFPLKGSKAGQTCSRPLCGKCSVKARGGLDYCPAHAAMVFRARPKQDITLSKPRRSIAGSKRIVYVSPVRPLEEAIDDFDQVPQ